jgi:hypothetical protein
MASAAHDQASGDLSAHATAIDQLHQRLAAAPGVDKQRLQHAVDKFKTAFTQFRDDALGCMN